VFFAFEYKIHRRLALTALSPLSRRSAVGELERAAPTAGVPLPRCDVGAASGLAVSSWRSSAPTRRSHSWAGAGAGTATGAGTGLTLGLARWLGREVW